MVKRVNFIIVGAQEIGRARESVSVLRNDDIDFGCVNCRTLWGIGVFVVVE